jgi:hypothetical protein
MSARNRLRRKQKRWCTKLFWGGDKNAVILSDRPLGGAKDLFDSSKARTLLFAAAANIARSRQILRCAQDDEEAAASSSKDEAAQPTDYFG